MQQRFSTCKATILRSKLKKNVARIAGPLTLTAKKSPKMTFSADNFPLQFFSRAYKD